MIMASLYKDVNIPIKVWLQTINLPQYASIFNKYAGAQELFEISESDAVKMGIPNPEHRTRIVSSLKMLSSRCGNQTSTADLGDKSAVDDVTSSLRNVSWFHGKISRDAAEGLVKQFGDFLVRESISQPGSYVLTCNHLGQPLHFVINKFSHSTDQRTSVEFGFESNRFTSVPALISSHVSSGEEITAVSHARIKYPVNRRSSLSALEASLGETKISSSTDYEMMNPVGHVRQRSMDIGQANRANSPLYAQRLQEQSLGSVGSVPTLNKNRVVSPATVNNNKGHETLGVPTSLNSRASSEGQLSRAGTSSSHLPHRSGELKTSRNASAHPVVPIRNRVLYDEGADYSDYFEVKRMPGESPKSTGGINQVQPGTINPVQSAASSLPMAINHRNVTQNGQHVNVMGKEKAGEDDYDVPAPEVREIHQFTTPIVPTNYVDFHNFQSKWLAEQNKPLDPDCMYKMKEVLLQVNHQLIAKHITYLDLHLLKVIATKNLGAGIFSGIEVLTLPQGQHLREAAIERHCCLSFLVSVTILASTDDYTERSKMVKQWILIARELLRTFGNLFSFAAIMNGLTGSSISRLKMTWSILERADPVLINQWRSQLLISYKDLTESASSLSLDNVSVPYVTPVCELLEDSLCEQLVGDLGTTLAHLDLARLMAGQTDEYSRKGVNILRYFQPRADLRDLFKVELHMKLLFGHRGASNKLTERKDKFEKILNILSERAEGSDIGTEC